MRVIIYSPVRLFGECIAGALQPLAAVTLAEAIQSTETLVERVRDLPADLVLFDVTGERALGEARLLTEACPELPVLAMAVPELAEPIVACADAGLAGYVPREATAQDLMGLLEMALRGECACSPRVTADLLRELCRRRGAADGQPPTEPLTRRETEVLRHVSHGHSNKEVARALDLSVATVKNHLHAIYAKLHVSRRSQAVDRILSHPPIDRGAWHRHQSQVRLDGNGRGASSA
jgi:DNA-binding NarL/FixJ family response regulator